eukprot:Pgem_evm1s5849
MNSANTALRIVLSQANADRLYLDFKTTISIIYSSSEIHHAPESRCSWVRIIKDFAIPLTDEASLYSKLLNNNANVKETALSLFNMKCHFCSELT